MQDSEFRIQQDHTKTNFKTLNPIPYTLYPISSLIRMPVMTGRHHIPDAAAHRIAGADGVSHTGADRVTGTDRMSDAGTNRTSHTIAHTDRTLRNRRAAGKSIGDRTAGRRVRPFDLDSLGIVFHFLQVHRAADDLKIRKADEQNTLPGTGS